MKKLKKLPSKERLEELFILDPIAGSLTWRPRADTRWSGKYAGTIAGAVFTQQSGRKYIVVGADSSSFYAHRIVWKMMTGEEPPEIIDHDDNNGLNNAWGNLRVADFAKNSQNSKTRRDNRVGLKGVVRSAAKSERYCARIVSDGVAIHLGSFATQHEAAEVRNRAALALHGEFARMG